MKESGNGILANHTTHGAGGVAECHTDYRGNPMMTLKTLSMVFGLVLFVIGAIVGKVSKEDEQDYPTTQERVDLTTKGEK